MSRELPSIEASADACVTALRLAGQLQDWNARYGPAFPAKDAMIFSLSCAFVAPWLDEPVLRLASRIWSWIVAVDDTVDSRVGDPAGVDQVIGACRAILAGEPPGVEPLARALAEIRADASALPGYPALAPLWHDAVERLLVGMAFEAVPGSAAPDVTEYLDHAAYTVGVPMYMLTLWAAMDDVDVAPLLSPLRDAALAVRLANDARGFARESAEGSLNALSVGMSPELVHRMVGDRLVSCRRGLAPLLARDFPPAVALERMARWGTRIYAHIDSRSPEREWAFLHW